MFAKNCTIVTSRCLLPAIESCLLLPAVLVANPQHAETYIHLCGTKLPTKELMTWNRGSFAEDNKVKCMFVYELYNKPNSKM